MVDATLQVVNWVFAGREIDYPAEARRLGRRGRASDDRPRIEHHDHVALLDYVAEAT